MSNAHICIYTNDEKESRWRKMFCWLKRIKLLSCINNYLNHRLRSNIFGHITWHGPILLLLIFYTYHICVNSNFLGTLYQQQTNIEKDSKCQKSRWTQKGFIIRSLFPFLSFHFLFLHIRHCYLWHLEYFCLKTLILVSVHNPHSQLSINFR